MKKFGTPIGAGPGRRDREVGFAGVGEPSGVLRRAVTSSTVSLCAPAPLRTLPSARLTGLSSPPRPSRWTSVAAARVATCRRPSCHRRSGCRAWPSGSGTSTSGDVGHGRDRRHRRRRRRGDRAEVDDLLHGRREAGDLDLLDRRAGRHVDRDGQDLARHERDLHAVHLGGSGRDEDHRVERGSGERDQQLAPGHPLNEPLPRPASDTAVLGGSRSQVPALVRISNG